MCHISQKCCGPKTSLTLAHLPHWAFLRDEALASATLMRTSKRPNASPRLLIRRPRTLAIECASLLLLPLVGFERHDSIRQDHRAASRHFWTVSTAKSINQPSKCPRPELLPPAHQVHQREAGAYRRPFTTAGAHKATASLSPTARQCTKPVGRFD